MCSAACCCAPARKSRNWKPASRSWNSCCRRHGIEPPRCGLGRLSTGAASAPAAGERHRSDGPAQPVPDTSQSGRPPPAAVGTFCPEGTQVPASQESARPAWLVTWNPARDGHLVLLQALRRRCSCSRKKLLHPPRFRAEDKATGAASACSGMTCVDDMTAGAVSACPAMTCVDDMTASVASTCSGMACVDDLTAGAASACFGMACVDDMTAGAVSARPGMTCVDDMTADAAFSSPALLLAMTIALPVPDSSIPYSFAGALGGTERNRRSGKFLRSRCSYAGVPGSTEGNPALRDVSLQPVLVCRHPRQRVCGVCAATVRITRCASLRW